MAFTLFSRILPSELANIIFDYVKLLKTQQIYWEQLYSPASLTLKNLINLYSDYDKVFNPICYNIDRITIITNITNRIASRGLLQKNIYIYMDEYIDNLYILKKHLQFHFKNITLFSYTIMLNKSMVDCLNKFKFLD